MEDNFTDLRLAVLIDAENVPRNSLNSVIEEVAVYGTPTIKRIYGDWTNPAIAGWKGPLLENAVTPIQQYSYTTGKNSSDSAMIIDAMDLLYSGKTDGFVIVSSDSDFTRLAIRLREAGQKVIGIGEKKTPKAFIAACDRFTYIEVIRKNTADAKHSHEQPEVVPGITWSVSQSAPKPVPRDNENARSKPQKLPKEIINLLADSIADLSSDDGGGVFMGELGNLLRRKKPDFDCRNYGYKTLSALIKSVDRFAIDFRNTTDPNIKHPYVKDKEA